MVDKVLLINPTQLKTEYAITNEQNHDISCRPPLGLLTLCAILKKNGIEYEFIDQRVDKFSFDDLLIKIKDNKYSFVGWYSSNASEDIVTDYIKKLKSKLKVNIATGGPGPSVNPQPYLQAGSDIACIGEGDVTILEILAYFKKNITRDCIDGIAYLEGEKITYTKPRKLIENISEIPFPAREQLKINAYKDYNIISMRTPYTCIITSRGCPYNCSYCNSPKLWKRNVRQRTVDNVLEEIDYVVKKYRVRFITFQDDVFGISEKWVLEFCEKLINRNYDLKWMCIIHPLIFLNNTEKIFKEMKEAGCTLLSIGLQSANPVILRNINRMPHESEAVEKKIEIARRLDLLTFVHFIFGLPGETEETIKDSIDFVMKIKPNFAEFFKLSVMHGTEIFEKYKDNPVCSLEKEVIHNYCVLASRKFYSDPIILYRNFSWVIRNNPGWFYSVLKFLPRIIRQISG